jgi:hypothetical protein
MTSKITTLFTSALALLSLQAFLSTSGPTALQVAFASRSVKYQPPGRVGPQRTEGSGTRSIDGVTCPRQSEKLFIAALSPSGHVGQTTLGRPTLYAYFTGSQTLEIRLREVGNFGTLWVQSITPKAPGFQAIAYPTNQPELVKGKNYEWSATVICDAKKFERIPSPIVGLLRVDAPANLQEQLNKARTTSDRAQIYATASLWHETLDTLVAAKFLNPKDKAIQTELIDLLDQVGLKKTAQRERDLVQKDDLQQGKHSPAPSTTSNCHSPYGVLERERC